MALNEGMLACAVDSVNKKELSIKKAAEAFGVSYGTLWRRLHGVQPGKGRPRNFTQLEEQQLVDLIVSCERAGIALPKRILYAVVRNAGIAIGWSKFEYGSCLLYCIICLHLQHYAKPTVFRHREREIRTILGEAFCESSPRDICSKGHREKRQEAEKFHRKNQSLDKTAGRNG